MDRPLHLLDSIGYIVPAMAGAVVVSGSHGGASAARYVLGIPTPPHAVLFNDAGIGKDRAGVVGLAMLEEHGIASAAYSHLSARIGDAADGLECGVISELNRLAAAAGLRQGMRVADAVALLRAEAAAGPTSAQ